MGILKIKVSEVSQVETKRKGNCFYDFTCKGYKCMVQRKEKLNVKKYLNIKSILTFVLNSEQTFKIKIY